MQRNDSGRLYDPNPSETANLAEVIGVGTRIFRLGFGGLLCLTGFFLALQVFFTVYEFVTEPESLQEVLMVWDTAGPVGEVEEPPQSDPAPATDSGHPAAETEESASTAASPEPPEISHEDGTVYDGDSDWFIGLLNTIVDDLAKGRLARPIGGFVLALFVTVLVQVALGFLKIGVGVLRQSNNPGER